MADYQKTAFLASIGFFALALVLTALVVLVPDIAELAIVSMLLIMLAGVLYAAFFLLLLYEIATSKNDNSWKLIWIVVAWAFGPVGAGAYFLIARKERRA